MKHIIMLMLIFFSHLLFNTVSANKQVDRENFLQAYEILHADGLFDDSHLQSYLLYPYLDYERIKQNLKKTSDQTLINFVENHADTWLADDIRTELLLRFAKQKKWIAILKTYRENTGGNKAKCAILEARINIFKGDSLAIALDDSINLWLSGRDRPRSCNPLFSLLYDKGFINDELAWKRIGLAMNRGATSLAKSLSKHTQDKTLVSLWVKARKKPLTVLKSKYVKQKNKRTRKVIAYAIKRLARRKTSKARVLWVKFQRSHSFTPAEKGDVESYILVREAQDHNPYALQKLSLVPSEYRSHDAQLWMSRLAIRQGEWGKLLNAIASMKTEEQQEDIWQYWKAYAEKKTGEKNTINLEELSKNTSFYGFLTADQLDKPYLRLLQEEFDWHHLIPDIKKLKSIQRATELFAIGKPRLAKKEWFWTLKKLNKRDKLVAAAYALEINQPFLAIVSVSKTKDWNQTGLRFPLEYKELVLNAANNQGIQPAWAYGVMRRESAFDAKIVSSAKAKGLMQILPSTAKLVAKKLGIKNHKTSDLLIPKKNARIGTAYLRQMLDRFNGNYVKATASYNAGPHRIPRWLPDSSISAARWIESIPFNETRNYVRAVMSYTTIYDHKLNYQNRKNLRLSQRLQTIEP